MNVIDHVTKGISVWLDAVAVTAVNMLDRFARPRTVKLLQVSSNEFELRTESDASSSERFQITAGLPARIAAALSGSRVELVLKSELFLFRPIELPSRATEFLQGIVRAQIDRLTPWSATAAAFGWGKPAESSSGSVALTIAATAQSMLKPYLDAIRVVGAHSIAIFTSPPDVDPAVGSIKVFEERLSGAKAAGRVRQALVIVLVAASVMTGAGLLAGTIVDLSLEARQSEVRQQLAKLRANAGTAQQKVERRKLQTPAAVVVLEALSEILPDHTYVTELHIDSNKVRLVGVSRDAASLIQLIERSGQFTRASFVAPTTRSASETTERFHIEAIIQFAAALRS